MQESDLQDLINNVRSFRDSDLNLFQLKAKFQKKTSLSTNADAEELPYHPSAVNKELEDYKRYAESLEGAFIAREAQDRFLRLLLQDPPFELTPDMKHSAEKETETLVEDIINTENEVVRLQNSLRQRYKHIEQTHQTLMVETEHITKLVDDIQAHRRELEQIEASTGSVDELKRSREELLEKQEKLTNRLVEINMAIDEKRETVERTKRLANERRKQVDALEQRLASLTADMSDVIKDTQRRDPAVEEATIWYKMVTDDCNRLFGIEKITETPSSVHVRFLNSAHDELRISFDQVTRELVDVETTGCDVQDILPLAKSCQNINEAITVIIRGTLSKLRP